MWDRATGEPIGPGIGWQDLRTVFDCIAAKAEHGVSLTPNQSITKLAWLLANVAGATAIEICASAPSTRWLAWTLTGGAEHVTDHTNAAVTGLCGGEPTGGTTTSPPPSASQCDAAADRRLERRHRRGDGAAGSPPIAALVGDQQASLVGQGCVRPGQAKITFGSGGMLDLCTGTHAAGVAPTGGPRHLPDRRLVA